MNDDKKPLFAEFLTPIKKNFPEKSLDNQIDSISSNHSFQNEFPELFPRIKEDSSNPNHHQKAKELINAIHEHILDELKLIEEKLKSFDIKIQEGVESVEKSLLKKIENASPLIKEKNSQIKEKPVIKRIVAFGDSLTDSGNMYLRRIFGLFKIPGTGLDKGGDGRFADGLSWPGFFSMDWGYSIMVDTVLKLQKQYGWSEEKAEYVAQAYWDDFLAEILQPTNKMLMLSDEIFRNYAQGGATAAKYSALQTILSAISDFQQGILSPLQFFAKLGVKLGEDISQFLKSPKAAISHLMQNVAAIGARGVVIDLDIQRKQFFEDQKKLLANKTEKQIQKMKDETQINVWAGGNDLITVNVKPSREIADKAIHAIIHHVKELKKNGYHNICVFNLPDLTKTPRYQQDLKANKISLEEIKNIQNIIKYFNEELAKEFEKLNFDGTTFDIHTKFDEIYNNPEKYGFDPNKLDKCLEDEKNYKVERGIMPGSGEGNLFWNPVHPGSKAQRDISVKLKQVLEKFYDFSHHNKICEFELIMRGFGIDLNYPIIEIQAPIKENLLNYQSGHKKSGFSDFSSICGDDDTPKENKVYEVTFKSINEYLRHLLDIDSNKAQQIMKNMVDVVVSKNGKFYEKNNPFSACKDIAKPKEVIDKLNFMLEENAKKSNEMQLKGSHFINELKN